MNVVECRDLAIGYGRNVIHEHINISIGQRDYACVIGNNGAGKSTLVKTILGLTPALAGEVWIQPDIDIGYLPQQSGVQKCFPTSAFEIVLSGKQNKSGLHYNKNDIAEAEEWMHKLGISPLKKKDYSELSGGQQQKVLLARALCASDKLLVLDEPITGLDVATQEYFYEIISGLNKSGTTVMMISHDKYVLDENATHVLTVNLGKIEYLPKSEYLKQREKEDE